MRILPHEFEEDAVDVGRPLADSHFGHNGQALEYIFSHLTRSCPFFPCSRLIPFSFKILTSINSYSTLEMTEG